MFTAALFTTTKRWNQPNGLITDKWLRKTQCIYMMRYYSAIINSELLSFSVICMELEEGMNFSFLGYHLEAIESSHGNTALMVLLLIPHIITPSLSISPKTVNHWHLFSGRTLLSDKIRHWFYHISFWSITLWFIPEWFIPISLLGLP